MGNPIVPVANRSPVVSQPHLASPRIACPGVCSLTGKSRLCMPKAGHTKDSSAVSIMSGIVSK
jgi:hypothetical protein